MFVNAIQRIIQFEIRGMSLVSGLTFFLGVPLFVAFIFGWNHVIVDRSTPLVLSLIFWAGLVMIVWLTSIAACHIAYHLLKKWEPRMIIVLLTGLAISTLALAWPMHAYSLWGRNMGRDALAPILYAPFALSFDYAFRLINGVLPGAFLWFGLNLFYDKALGIRRYSYQPDVEPEADPGSSRTADSNPAFMSRLPAATYGKLIAMKAEDHYVRVYTDHGNSLVHYRFNDAISDVSGQSGLQTHRSWWVREAEIVRMKTQGHRIHLVLSSGLEVPVSRSYLNSVKRSLDQLKSSREQAGQTGNPDVSPQTLH